MASGSIRKRIGVHGDVSYQVIIEQGSDPVTGKRIRTTKTIKGTKKQAEQYLRKMLNALDENQVLKPSTERLKDWLEEWLDNFCVDIEQTTRDGYVSQIQSLLNPYLGEMQLHNIKTTDIQAWINTMREKGYRPKTIRNAYHILKSALEKAVVIQITDAQHNRYNQKEKNNSD